MLGIDVGCGPNKRPGYFGLDACELEGVDQVLDLEKDMFNITSRSIDHVYSSHCFEHIVVPNNVWSEISRVIKVEGLIEIWTPYPHSDDQWLLGHKAGWSWSRWDHVASRFRAFYSPRFLGGGYWRWVEARYVVEASVIARLKRNNIRLEIGVHHMINVVREWGCFFEYTLDDPGAHAPKETICAARDAPASPLEEFDLTAAAVT